MSKKLKDVLSNHNVEGEIYVCDIRDWLGLDLELEKVLEIREELSKIK